MENLDLMDVFKIYDDVNGDLRFLFNSDLRVKVLISLGNGKKNVTELRKELNIPSSTIIHGIKPLMNKNIISREFKIYSLTSKGKIISDNLIDMIESAYALDNCQSLFLDHDVSSIPTEFIKDLGSLKNSKIVRSTSTNIMKPHNVLSDYLSASRTVKHLSSIFFASNVQLIFSNLEKNRKVHLLITQKILDKILEMPNQEIIKKGLAQGNLKLGIIGDDTKLSFTIGDNFMVLGLYFVDRTYDLNAFIMNENREAVLWGERLFNHYLESSKEFRL